MRLFGHPFQHLRRPFFHAVARAAGGGGGRGGTGGAGTGGAGAAGAGGGMKSEAAWNLVTTMGKHGSLIYIDLHGIW